MIFLAASITHFCHLLWWCLSTASDACGSFWKIKAYVSVQVKVVEKILFWFPGTYFYIAFWLSQ
ncbi:hypothetical protein AtNW77_Chr1g0038141 [Arabidopsis thaliana]